MSEQDNYSALRRRLAAPVLQSPEVSRGVVDNSGLIGRMVNRASDNFDSQFSAYAGLANKALGDEAAAQANFQEFDRLQRRARDAFELQSLDDVEAAGGGIKNYAKFALGEAVNFAPDIVGTVLPAIATGGIAGVAAGAARGASSKLAREAAKSVAEDAVRKAARGELKDVAQSAAEGTMRSRLAGTAGTAENIAAASAAGRDAGLEAVRGRLVGDKVASSIQQAVDRGQRVGQFAGSTAAQSVGLSRESVDVVRDQDAAAARSVMATDLFAGSIGSVPALRLLDRYGVGAQALPAPALRTLIPRVSREFVAQGVSESATELAQTAAQLWGHKQVMDSIDLLGPKAFDQYTSALLGGFLAGGMLGGGAEGFRGSGTGLAKLVGFTRDSAKQSLRDFRQRVGAGRDPNAPVPSPVPGAPTAVSPAAAPTPSPVVATAPAAAQAAPAVPTPSSDVVSAFQQNRAALGPDDPTPSSPGLYDATEADYDTELDRLVAGASSEMKTLFEGMQQSPMQLPVRFESRIQSLLMSNLDPEWTGFSDASTARGTATALEKLFIPGAELTAQDDAYLSMLTAGERPALAMDTLAKWFTVGPAIGKLDEIATRTTAAEPEVDAPTGADELAAMAANEGMDVSGAETTADVEARALARAGMSVRAADPTSAPQSPEATEALRRQGDTPEDPALGRIERLKSLEAEYAALREQGVTGDALFEASTALTEARSAARADILGFPTGNQPFGANVVYALPNAKGKQAAEYASAVSKPHFLEIADPTAPQGAKTAINLQNLVTQQRVRTPDVSVREALINGLSNLRDLGINFDINTLRPFEVRGERLSPRDVAAIKAPATARRTNTEPKAPTQTPFNSTKEKAAWVTARAAEIARAEGRDKPSPADRTRAVDELNAESASRFASAMAEQSRGVEVEGVPGTMDEANRSRQGPRPQVGGRVETVDGRSMVVPEDAPVSVTPRGQALPNAALNNDVDTASAASKAERARIKARLTNGIEQFMKGLDERRVDASDPATRALQKMRRGQELTDDDIANVVTSIAPMIRDDRARRALAMRVEQYFDGVQSDAATRATDAVAAAAGADNVRAPVASQSNTQFSELEAMKDRLGVLKKELKNFLAPQAASATVSARNDRLNRQISMLEARIAAAEAQGARGQKAVPTSPEERAARVAEAQRKQAAIAADPTKRPAPQTRKVPAAAAPKTEQSMVEPQKNPVDDAVRSMNQQMSAFLEMLEEVSDPIQYNGLQRRMLALLPKSESGQGYVAEMTKNQPAINRLFAELEALVRRTPLAPKAAVPEAAVPEAAVPKADAQPPDEAATNTKAPKTETEAKNELRGDASEIVATSIEELYKQVEESRASKEAALKTEQSMVDALTDAMGVPRVILGELTAKNLGDGIYTVGRKGNPLIRIHPRLKGRERFSVIAHELGHHVITTEIMRGVEGSISYRDALALVSGTDPTSSARFQLALQAANPELYTAIKSDYDKWREAAVGPASTFRQVRSTRATRARAKGTETRSKGAPKPLEDVSAAKREYLFDFHEYIADGIARAIEGNSTAQGVVGQFFKRMADQLRRLYNAIVKNNPEWRSPPSIEAYVNGLFDKRRNTVAEVLGQPVSNAQAKAAVEAAAATVVATAPQTAGAPPTPPPGPPGGSPPPTPQPPTGDIDALAKYVARVMPPDTRLLIERVINRGGTTFQKLFSGNLASNTVGSPTLQALRTRFAADPEAVRKMDTEARGMEYRIAGLLVMYSEQGTVGAPRVNDLLRNWSDQMWELVGRIGDDALVTQALDDVLTGRIDAAKKAGTLYTPSDRAVAKNKALNRTLLKLNQYYDSTTEVLSRYWTGRQDRVNSFGIPALRQVMALVHRRAGATDRIDGLLEDKVQKSYALIEKYRDATGSLTDAQRAQLLDSLQSQTDAPTGDAAVDAAQAKVREFFDTLHTYLRGSGVDVPRREAFYPVRMLLDNDAKIDQFRQLMSDEKFYEPMRKALGKGADVTQAELVKDMEHYLTAPADWQAVAQNTGGVPNFKSLKARLAQFVYDLGTPEQISAFKALQNPDMDAVFGEYIMSSVNRAEFAKRFGDDGGRLDTLYVNALDQGATPDQLKYVQDVVRSAVGLYALDGSPLLSKLSPQIGALFNKQGTKEASELMMAYQNWRNLPLAVLSSATEIFGPSVRSGGDLQVAWTGLKTTIKTLVDGSERAQLQALLKQMGYSQDFAIGENQQSMFGGSENSKLARGLNDTLFRWNGLTRWTTATRFGSLVAAQQFLIKHADGKGKDSARYLEELNLRPGDVQLVQGTDSAQLYLASDAELQQASPAERERDARVKRALMRFVDEAVPRPNVAQTPLYYSDPAMQFVVQYKAVLHAVYQQYYKRIAKEMAYGNIAPLMPALFMAATAGVAELLREGIQWAGEGNPRRKDWGVMDYAMLGAERTALMPPSITLHNDLLQDFNMRHAEDIFLGSSQLGPTIKQAMQVQSAASGARPAAQVAENALPASALWKQWINPTEWNKETPT